MLQGQHPLLQHPSLPGPPELLGRASQKLGAQPPPPRGMMAQAELSGKEQGSAGKSVCLSQRGRVDSAGMVGYADCCLHRG